MISRYGDGHSTARYFELLSVGLAWRHCPAVATDACSNVAPTRTTSSCRLMAMKRIYGRTSATTGPGGKADLRAPNFRWAAIRCAHTRLFQTLPAHLKGPLRAIDWEVHYVAAVVQHHRDDLRAVDRAVVDLRNFIGLHRERERAEEERGMSELDQRMDTLRDRRDAVERKVVNTRSLSLAGRWLRSRSPVPTTRPSPARTTKPIANSPGTSTASIRATAARQSGRCLSPNTRGPRSVNGGGRRSSRPDRSAAWNGQQARPGRVNRPKIGPAVDVSLVIHTGVGGANLYGRRSRDRCPNKMRVAAKWKIFFISRLASTGSTETVARYWWMPPTHCFAEASAAPGRSMT